MRMIGLLGLLAAISLSSGPVMAQPVRNSAAALSLHGTLRAGAPMQKMSRVEGDSTWLVIGGAVTAGIFLWFILDDDDDDEAVSA